jgi:hypothetical protein
MNNLIEKTVTVIQEGQHHPWRYTGKVTHDDTTHLTLIDEKTQREMILRKDTLISIEVAR